MAGASKGHARRRKSRRGSGSYREDGICGASVNEDARQQGHAVDVSIGNLVGLGGPSAKSR